MELCLAQSCPLCGHHSVFSVPPPARLNHDFLSSRGGERQSVCAARFNGELCFLLASALPEPAPNFLQPGSGLGK